MRHYDVKETAKLIREALKQAYPEVKFSVRLSRYSGGCSIDASWTDGPTAREVNDILDTFNGQGFDGMQDLSYHCGRRTFKGEQVDFHSGYVRGQRDISAQFLRLVAARVAKECNLLAPPVNDKGYIEGNYHEIRAPYQWHSSWSEKPLTMYDFLSSDNILAHDSHEGEYLTRLIDRIAQHVSLKRALPVDLPKYLKDESEVA